MDFNPTLEKILAVNKFSLKEDIKTSKLNNFIRG